MGDVSRAALNLTYSQLVSSLSYPQPKHTLSLCPKMRECPASCPNPSEDLGQQGGGGGGADGLTGPMQFPTTAWYQVISLVPSVNFFVCIIGLPFLTRTLLCRQAVAQSLGKLTCSTITRYFQNGVVSPASARRPTPLAHRLSQVWEILGRF